MISPASLALGVLTATITLAAAACTGKDRNSCEYWVEKLEKGEQVQEAVQRSGELQCVSALPGIAALYEKGELQEQAFEATKRIGDREGALPLIKIALKSNDHSRRTAELIAEWKLKSAKPELIAILTDDQYSGLREPVFKALLALEEPAALEDVLIHVAGTDLQVQDFLINKRAIEELAKLKSKKAVPTLIKMAFARNMRGQEVYRWVRRALAEIGEPTLVEQLFAVLEGKNEAVIQTVQAAGQDDWEWKSGPKVAQLLTDTLDPRITEPLAQHLAADLKGPVNPNKDQQQRWSMHQKNRLKFIMFGLSHIGSEIPVNTLGRVLEDRSKDTISQRVNAGYALAHIGSEAAQDALIAAYRKDSSELFKGSLLQILGLGLDDRRAQLWDAMINEQPFPGEEPPKKPRLPKGTPEPEVPSAAVKAVLGESGNATLKTYLAVQKDCAAELSCYLSKLQNGTRDEKIKALTNLAHGHLGGTQNIRDAIFEAFKNAPKGEIDVRRYALIALTRLGDAHDGQKILDYSQSLTDPFEEQLKERLKTQGEKLPELDTPPEVEGEKKPEDEPDVFYKDELFVLGHAMVRRGGTKP